MNNKRIVLLAMALFGLLAVPAANAEVVVRYIVVDDGYGGYYRQNNRLYSNISRVGSITYSNNTHYRNRYRDRCEDDRYYSERRQYRNNYYYGNQNYNNNRHNRSYYRDDRRRSSGHHRDKHHGYYRSPANQDKHMHSSKGGRVHINIK